MERDRKGALIVKKGGSGIDHRVRLKRAVSKSQRAYKRCVRGGEATQLIANQ